MPQLPRVVEGRARISRSRLGAAALMLWVASAEGHHFFATEYEPDATVTIQGTVSEVRYRNPHAQILIAVPAPAGKAEIWAANTVSPRSLPRRGWGAETVRVGQSITVSGNLGRDGAPRVWIQELIVPGSDPIYPVGRAIEGPEN